MQYNVYSKSLQSSNHELAILPANYLDTQNESNFLLEYKDAFKAVSEGNIGYSQVIYKPTGAKFNNLLIVNTGKTNNISLSDYSKVIKECAKYIKQHNIKSSLLACEDIQVIQTKDHSNNLNFNQAVIGLENEFYLFSQCKSNKVASNHEERIISFLTTSEKAGAAENQISQGLGISKGMHLCKDLANLPGNLCTPSYLVETAEKLSQETTIKTSVLNEKQMAELKMGSLLSVSKGSDEEAFMITMEYNGGNPEDAPIILVGKGLTFDAGGISIKPAAAMDEMKYDMCGGASVFGVMKALSEIKPNINVIGIVPTSENLINGRANKPGDIVTAMSGKTIEILNTDAEGRLILCDALHYAKKYNPKVIIDIATLTGACIIALGHHMSGLFSNDDELAKQLESAGEEINDQAWRLPLHSSYTKQLHSNFADLANIGGRAAGAVTAASFLQEFVDKDTPWAHLDIAGTAWKSGAQKGATARPVNLLVQYILNQT